MVRREVSVVELLQSGRLSNDIFFLQHEDGGSGPVADDVKMLPRRRTMHNAVRVALLLSRSFIRGFEDTLNWGPSTQLSDFWVYFEEQDQPNEAKDCEGCVSTSGPSQEITLLGMGLRHQQQHINFEATPMQLLGRLLYSVFSEGGSPEMLVAEDMASVTDGSLSTENSEGGSSNISHGRSTQRMRVAAESVFSKLVDDEALPLSICRFISDMSDGGPGGKADAPFTSFSDVVQDLEQMISRPEIFLHDSYHPHRERWTPLFGRMCTGRRDEAGTIMRTTDQIEQSSKREFSADEDEGSESLGLETVFVSGTAGSGKSHLIHALGETLEMRGWFVTKAKFERGKEYTSGGMVSMMFDNIISHLIEMKEGGVPEDVAYCERVSKSILDSTDEGILLQLVGFVPRLYQLIINIDGGPSRAEFPSGRQLVYPLSKVLEAVLEPGRFLMIVADDLQWADANSISLIREVLVRVGGVRNVSRRCLFVGLFRPDEVDDGHPLSALFSFLQMSSFVNTNEIKLSPLSRNGIVDIVMTGLKLPHRIVAELADAVHKKTSGHALFVIELLNSLLNENIIYYSALQHSFTWDPDRIDFIQISENVAELIASNLKSFSEQSQFALQIISCFGIQSDIPLLQVVEQHFQTGIITSLDDFIDRGILDRAGPIVMFTHDLILQAAYEGIPLTNRRFLHLQIGQYLGASAMEVSAATDNQQLDEHTPFAGNQVTSSLLSLACDQINFAGVDSIDTEGEKLKFAKWNVTVGQKSLRKSDFSAAYHYFEKGQSFLGEGCWKKDLQLSTEMHKCMVTASFALGQTNKVIQHVNELTDHVSFHEALEYEVLVFRSLCNDGRIEEAITQGLKTLRRLDFNIPDSPTNQMVKHAMSGTGRMVSKYSIEDILSLCDKFNDESKRFVSKIVGLFDNLLSYAPLLVTLLACESVKYSLQHGVCFESAHAFAVYAMALVRNENYASAKRCADISIAILSHYQTADQKGNKAIDLCSSLRVRTHLYGFVDVWFDNWNEIGQKMIISSVTFLKRGLVEYYRVCQYGWSYRLQGGENLSLISESSLSRFRWMAKHSQFNAKYMLSDCVLLAGLTGKSDKDYFSALEGSISCLDDVLTEAESNNQFGVTCRLEVAQHLLSYWRRDYAAAEKHYRNAWANPNLKQSPINFTSLCFFGGLVSFYLYRSLGGDERLKEGREMMVSIGKWANNSKVTFESQKLLLKAEHAASIGGKRNVVEQFYKDAMIAAQDHGNIYVLALGYELFGDYYASNGCMEDSSDCYQKSYVYCSQWGATAVAERMIRDHNLDIMPASDRLVELQKGNLKHPRQDD